MTTKNPLLFAISDSSGFVGAFSSEKKARDVLRTYISIPLIVTTYPRETKLTSVWALPYRGNNAVAYVSDSKSKIREIQIDLLRVGLTFPDDVDFWEHEIDKVSEAAAKRFAIAQSVISHEHSAHKSRDQKNIDRFIKFASKDDPPPKLARLNLLESVVPVRLVVEKPKKNKKTAAPPSVSEQCTLAKILKNSSEQNSSEQNEYLI